MAPSPPGDRTALLLSSLQVASQSWTSFDWNNRRQQWDQTIAQSKEQKDQSLTARKQLADTTKQFKRSVKGTEQASLALAENPSSQQHVDASVKAVDGLTKECRKTVKAYQEEIDNLTRRCKSSDAAFGSLYQALSEVPDPASLMVASMEQMHGQQSQISQLLRTVDECNREMQTMERNMAQQAETYQKEITQLKESKKANDTGVGQGMSKADREELVQLRREVAEYEVEFRGLKNQDITIRKLEAKIAELQKSGQEELQKELKKAQEDLAETEGRRAAEALEREALMERKVQDLELQLKAERAGREATQAHLLKADEGAGEREAAWEAQRQILVDDAARLRETLHEATRERDALRLRVAALDGDTDSRPPSAPASGSLGMADMILERKAYEAEVSELSHTANTLREELRAKEAELAEDKHSSMMTIEALEHERAMLLSSVSALESKLAAAPSQERMDNMKRELRILKRLEYNADDVDAERDPEMTTGGGTMDGEDADLESVLVSKLRRVESELVKERNQKSETYKECEELNRKLASAEQAQASAEKLVASLEADLEKAIATPAMAPSASKKSSSSSLETSVVENPATLQRILDPDAPPPSGGVPVPAPIVSTTAAEKASDDHSVATIIMAQRDRLRARCEALEAERDSFKKELQIQVQSAESLKTDNTKLYEKVRYLQNFSSQSSRGGMIARKSDRDLDLEALEQRYEASVDPFRQFSRSERQRKMNEMSPVERAVFIVAKTVLGSKEMRTALFVYVVAMHMLVFITTYHWSHESGCHNSIHDNEHLSHLPPNMQLDTVVAKVG